MFFEIIPPSTVDGGGLKNNACLRATYVAFFYSGFLSEKCVIIFNQLRQVEKYE